MRIARVLAVSVLCASAAPAAEWVAAPDGKASNAGVKDSPWDIVSALGGGQKKLAPGDTLWLRGGTYKVPFTKGQNSHGYEVKLAGVPEKPIKIQATPGARVSIDGGLNIQNPSTNLWLVDLEIMASESRPDKPLGPANTANALPAESNIALYRPWSGLNVYSGKGMKFINLVVHDNCQGVSWWVASDGEMYGCIIYDNGWSATDRGHGHCVYTQNKDGIETISNCIMSCMFDGTYTMHAYGSARADVDNYIVEDNIAFEKGKFLIGGGKPSHNIKAFRNYLHNMSMRIGYDAPENEDCEIRDNVILNGDLNIKNYKKAINENNLVVKPGGPRPAEPRSVFLPNKYDTSRAHVAVFNFPKAVQVGVKMEKWLKAGETVRLLNPKDLWGKPVWEGKAAGDALNVPTPGEFAVYVVQKVK